MIHLHYHDRDIEDPWLRARLAMLPAGARILDVGCVDGWVLDEYPAARGVDVRPPKPAWVDRVLNADAEHTRLPDASFDAVTCVSVLEHVGLGWYGDNVGATGEGCKAGRIVAEMARVLAPGGWMLLTVPVGLKMTKDGRPFARPIDAPTVRAWIDALDGMIVREWLDIETTTWTAAPDDRPYQRRRLLLVAVEKAGAVPA